MLKSEVKFANYTWRIENTTKSFREPLAYKTPKIILVENDLSFAARDFLWTTLDVLSHPNHRKHTYLFLLSSPFDFYQRVVQYLHAVGRNRLTPNVWFGIEALSQCGIDKLAGALLTIPACVHFIYAKPLGQISLTEKAYMINRHRVLNTTGSHNRIKWVICGCPEVIRNPKTYKANVERLLHECVEMNLPFFFDGWGSFAPNSAGMMMRTGAPRSYTIENKYYHQYPDQCS